MHKPKIYCINSKRYLDALREFINHLISQNTQKKLVVVLPSYLSIDILKIFLISKNIIEKDGPSF